jgi:hypothetical protein
MILLPTFLNSTLVKKNCNILYATKIIICNCFLVVYNTFNWIRLVVKDIYPENLVWVKLISCFSLNFFINV